MASFTTPPASRTTTPIIPTPIYIDSIPEYYSLSACAERPLSAIVRAMKSGCGDGSRTTSYACFCIDSSSHYNSLIGAQVSTSCAAEDGGQQNSAIGVFDRYCQIGVGTSGEFNLNLHAYTKLSGIGNMGSYSRITPTSATTSAQITSTSSSLANSSSSFSSATLSSISSLTALPQTSQSNPTPRLLAITLSTTLPALFLSILIAGFLYRRRRVKAMTDNAASPQSEIADPMHLEYEKTVTCVTHELPVTVAELPHQEVFAELDGKPRNEERTS